jgi:hypothetical protein
VFRNQKALHAKTKAEAGYRFYALYDKISREDILAHAYAQPCGAQGNRSGSSSFSTASTVLARSCACFGA